jgi:hypothetical protein
MLAAVPRLWKRPMDTPVQSASVFGNDNIVVQASGSGVNVTIGPQPQLTRYVNQTKLEIQRDSETAWLSTYRTDVVPLIGRESAKDELKAWLNRDAPVSIRVLVGAGVGAKRGWRLRSRARSRRRAGWLDLRQPKVSTVSVNRTTSWTGVGISPSWSYSTTPRAASSHCAHGFANWSAPRLKVGQSCGCCCLSGRPVARSAGMQPFSATAMTRNLARRMRCSIRKSPSSFRRSTSLNFAGKCSALCSSERMAHWRRQRKAPTPNSTGCLPTANGRAIRSIS